MAYRIITSIIDSAKAATQISMENKIPQSSTYKKIKKLQRSGLVRFQKYELDETVTKVLLYRSNIASFEFKMERGRVAYITSINKFMILLVVKAGDDRPLGEEHNLDQAKTVLDSYQLLLLSKVSLQRNWQVLILINLHRKVSRVTKKILVLFSIFGFVNLLIYF